MKRINEQLARTVSIHFHCNKTLKTNNNSGATNNILARVRDSPLSPPRYRPVTVVVIQKLVWCSVILHCDGKFIERSKIT
jgi:hypothetical protein